MPNGSLDMWIHPSLHQGRSRRVLSLGQRISIAADVASALDYLHNQLIPPLIHCDLKLSDVLLDADMTEDVSDFGLARILCVDEVIALASSMGIRGTISISLSGDSSNH